MPKDLGKWLNTPANQYVEPWKPFDNVDFVGVCWVSAWLVHTDDGVVLIDTLYSPFKKMIVDKLLIGIQGIPTFSAHFGPTAGRNGSWGEPLPDQPDLLAANQPCWPFRRCLMKRSFYNK